MRRENAGRIGEQRLRAYEKGQFINRVSEIGFRVMPDGAEPFIPDGQRHESDAGVDPLLGPISDHLTTRRFLPDETAN